MDTLYLPRIGDDKVKDKIIESLSKDHSLSLKELGLNISRNSSVTYQAVHKAMQELMEKGIIEREENRYKISRNWIKMLRGFIDCIEHDYRHIIGEMKNGKPVRLTLNTDADVDRFVFSFLSNISGGQKKSVYMNLRHSYTMKWMGEEEYKKFMEDAKNIKYSITCDTDSEMNHWIAKFWEELGSDISFGTNFCSTCDYIAIDDYIMHLSSTVESKKLIDEIRMGKNGEYKASHTPASLDYIPVNIMIVRDKELAEEIKERTQKEIEKRKTA